MSLKSRLRKMLPESLLDYRRYLRQKLAEKKQKRAYNAGKCEEFLKGFCMKRRGMKVDFENPKTFTEKQQWLKLYGVTELKQLCSDKFLVRNYISNLIGEEYLIPIVKNNGKDHFYDAMDICYDELPNQFCIQCNHGSGMTYLVKNKEMLGRKGFKRLQKKLNRDLKLNYAFVGGMELVYKNITPCIYITQYLSINGDLPDYKCLCLNGKPVCISVDSDRFSNHKRQTYNIDFTPSPFSIGDYGKTDIIEKPKNYDKYIDLCSFLSQPFDVVRVDFYNVDGKLYFGELTFSSASGLSIPKPEKYNVILGNTLKLGDKLPIV